MPIFQDNVLGQNYLTVVEKLTGEDHSLLLHLNYDVPLSRLVKQLAMEFQAGEGYSRVPTGDPIAPTGHTESVGPILAAARAYVLTASGGGALDQGLSLHENSVAPNATIELHLRT
jgi:hypothetical protein